MSFLAKVSERYSISAKILSDRERAKQNQRNKEELKKRLSDDDFDDDDDQEDEEDEDEESHFGYSVEEYSAHNLEFPSDGEVAISNPIILDISTMKPEAVSKLKKDMSKFVKNGRGYKVSATGDLSHKDSGVFYVIISAVIDEDESASPREVAQSLNAVWEDVVSKYLNYASEQDRKTLRA